MFSAWALQRQRAGVAPGGPGAGLSTPEGPAGSLEQLDGGQKQTGPCSPLGISSPSFLPEPPEPTWTVQLKELPLTETPTVESLGSTVGSESPPACACVPVYGAPVRPRASPLTCFPGVLTWVRSGPVRALSHRDVAQRV